MQMGEVTAFNETKISKIPAKELWEKAKLASGLRRQENL